ncbi:unnamed protein product [Closterium sp. Naga37s-1]|nr:unnamed protein product [Closterium sp. Naga37s-1]
MSANCPSTRLGQHQVAGRRTWDSKHAPAAAPALPSCLKHLAAAESTWRQQKAPGGSRKHLAAAESTWRQQKAPGGSRKHLAAAESTWRQQKAPGGSRKLSTHSSVQSTHLAFHITPILAFPHFVRPSNLGHWPLSAAGHKPPLEFLPLPSVSRFAFFQTSPSEAATHSPLHSLPGLPSLLPPSRSPGMTSPLAAAVAVDCAGAGGEGRGGEGRGGEGRGGEGRGYEIAGHAASSTAS